MDKPDIQAIIRAQLIPAMSEGFLVESELYSLFLRFQFPRPSPPFGVIVDINNAILTDAAKEVAEESENSPSLKTIASAFSDSMLASEYMIREKSFTWMDAQEISLYIRPSGWFAGSLED